MKPIRFRNDKRLRDKLFTSENYLHPAKGHLGLWQAIIEKYTAPGDTILDPMAGVGATLTAALMGRNVVCVELEPHWVTPMKASWEKMRQHPMLGCSMGEVLILRGDARCLPLGSADHIVTSPPFQRVEPWQDKGFEMHDGRKQPRRGITSPGYTRPQAIITSPPYEGTKLAGGDVKKRKARVEAKYGDVNEYRRSLQAQGKDSHHTFSKGQYAQQDYSPASENIGNQRGGDLAILLVYNRLRRELNLPVGVQICHKCLPENTHAPQNGELESGHPTMVSPSQNKQGQTALHGREVVPGGGALLGISKDGKPLNGTISPALNAEEPLILLSIMSKMQKKLAENGITASEIWLQSAAPATIENTPSSVTCTLCNVSLVANPSNPQAPTPNTVLRLQFVEPRLIPLNIIVGRRNDYWSSMAQTYAECHRVLRPGGIMALVLKGFTRNGVYQDLPAQTAELVESLGFIKFDEWQRQLWGLSFWRILQGTDKEETVIAHRGGLFDLDIQEVKQMKRVSNGKLDERLRFEHVLAFRKDG